MNHILLADLPAFFRFIKKQSGFALTGILLLTGVIALSGIQVSTLSKNDFSVTNTAEVSSEVKKEVPQRICMFDRSKGLEHLSTTLQRKELQKTEEEDMADSFVSGSYTGCLGYWNLWVPEASFVRTGDIISGWMILVHDDFVVKQHFSGKVILDISGPHGSDYRHVKADIFGTKVDYLETSSFFNENLDQRPNTFIRQIHYSAFSKDNTDGTIVMLGRINYSGLDQDFPAYFYNLYGNFILTKL